MDIENLTPRHIYALKRIGVEISGAGIYVDKGKRRERFFQFRKIEKLKIDQPEVSFFKKALFHVMRNTFFSTYTGRGWFDDELDYRNIYVFTVDTGNPQNTFMKKIAKFDLITVSEALEILAREIARFRE